jgi:hypothetical protein
MKAKPTDSGPLKRSITKLSSKQKAQISKKITEQPGTHRASTLAHHVSGMNENNPSHSAAIGAHLQSMTDTGAMTKQDGGNAGYVRNPQK